MPSPAHSRDDLLAELRSALEARQVDRATALARQALVLFPSDPAFEKLLDVTKSAQGPANLAWRTDETPLDAIALRGRVATALSMNQTGVARDVIVAAEREGGIEATEITLCKARVLIHEHDFEAARAVLIMGLEAAPSAVDLQTLLARLPSLENAVRG